MNLKGDRMGCQLRQIGSDKRFCSLNITICAEPALTRLVPIEIIFGILGHISEEEREFYAALTNLRVRWQNKAWADEPVCMAYFQDFRADTAELGEVLLGMDNHKSQKTVIQQAWMREMHIFPLYIPANCTDVINPPDKNVCQTLKVRVYGRLYTEFEQHYEQWDRMGLPEPNKRMLVARLVSEEWAKMCEDSHHLIRSSFVSTGWLLAKDGSEASLVKLWKHSNGEYTTNPDGTPYSYL